jgi:hypothetical protein
MELSSTGQRPGDEQRTLRLHQARHVPGRRRSCVSSGGCCGRAPFMPPSQCWSRHSRPAWGQASTGLLGKVIDMHGEQNGSVYQKVTLGRSDLATVSPLAEDRAGVLECCLDCKHGHHRPHLHLTHTASSTGPGRGIGPHRRPSRGARNGRRRDEFEQAPA